MIVLVFGSCEDFLDRQPLTNMNDQNFWTSENNLRLFANSFYTNYFVGYNTGFALDYAPLRGFSFSDDLTSVGKQASFENQPPPTRQGGGSRDQIIPEGGTGK